MAQVSRCVQGGRFKDCASLPRRTLVANLAATQYLDANVCATSRIWTRTHQIEAGETHLEAELSLHHHVEATEISAKRNKDNVASFPPMILGCEIRLWTS